MKITPPIFSIHITTKNRVEALTLTLKKCEVLLNNPKVECIICDDASTDGTSVFVRDNYPKIRLITHTENKGYIYNRNHMLAITEAKYAISLDDDAYFLSTNVLETIVSYFQKNKDAGLIACRIYWGLEDPVNLQSNEKSEVVQGYVGCGHIWKMEAWKSIPKYPEWFVFYGEEQYGAYQLFKNGWEVHYVPDLLVKHCVNVKSRKNNADYVRRMRRGLRAGWYLYFLVFPMVKIPKRFFYTLWVQLKTKVFKGNLKGGLAIFQALFDVVLHTNKFMTNKHRLTTQELKVFEYLPPTKIYWKPGIEINKSDKL